MNTLVRRLALAGAVCIAIAVSAADTPQVKSVLFKDGKLTATYETGKSDVVTNETVLGTDITVATNATFIVGKGKSRKFLDGQHLEADGNLTSADGTVVPVADHIVMKGGRLTIVKDGEPTKATAELTLGDGSRIKPDGTIAGVDGRLRRMLDGQILKFSGEVIPSTDTVTVKDGVVILQKDGGKVMLKRGQIISMSDGSKVGWDGMVTKMDGSRVKVAEGEIYKLEGVLPAKRQ